MITHEEVRNIVDYYVGSLAHDKVLRAYITEQEKKDELLELKNCEIKLLKARLTYNDNDELDEVLFFENSNALIRVRNQIKSLEEELK